MFNHDKYWDRNILVTNVHAWNKFGFVDVSSAVLTVWKAYYQRRFMTSHHCNFQRLRSMMKRRFVKIVLRVMITSTVRRRRNTLWMTTKTVSKRRWISARWKPSFEIKETTQTVISKTLKICSPKICKKCPR